MKKLLTLILAAIMCLGSLSLVGCGDNPDEHIDDTKSQLYVGLFKSGLGRAWLDEAIEDFEEKYANVSFEEGKTGVQVQVDYKVAEFKTGAFPSNVKSFKNAIYYMDQSAYTNYVGADLLRDITDVMNNKVYDANGNILDIGIDKTTGKLVLPTSGATSLFSRMNDGYDDYLKYTDGKYYAVPYYITVSGAVYDADYFSESKLYFFKEADADGNRMGATLEDIDRGESADGREIGYGPDGKKGTADDGMPETWNDFLDMMSAMQGSPFIWSGAENYQRRNFYRYIWANYEGAENYLKNFTLDGDIEEIANQEGRKAALQAFKDILDGGYYYKGWAETDEYMSQLKFVRSINENERIAMLVDGGYWEVCMIDEFEKMGKVEGLGWGERDFRLFPIPNFVGVDGITDQTNTSEPEVITGGGAESIIFMPKTYSGQTTIQDSLAELFLYFTHDRAQMVQFSAYTGSCIRPFDYEVKDEEMQTLTKLGQSVFRYIKEGATVIGAIPLSDKVKANESTMFGEMTNKWNFNVTVGNVSYKEPVSYFLANTDKTVDECYQAVVNSAKNCIK